MATTKIKKALTAAEELKTILDDEDPPNMTLTENACKALHEALQSVQDEDKRKKVALWLGDEHLEEFNYWVEQQAFIWREIAVEDINKHQLSL